MKLRKAADAPPNPTAYSTLWAKPVKSLPYPLTLRVHDWIAGRRDGRVNLSGITGTPGYEGGAELTPGSTVWLAHNEHREIERHHHEQLGHQARTVQLQIRRDTVIADLATAQEGLAEAKASYEALPAPNEAQLTQRGAAESRVPEQVVRARRAKEHQAAVIQPAQQRFAAAQQRLDSLTAELHQIAAQLDTLAEVTATRQVRITELHQRRNAVYRRAYLRAHQRALRRRQPTGALRDNTGNVAQLPSR